VKAGGVVLLDPFGDRDLDIVDAAPMALLGEDAGVADEFGLEDGVERLGCGIVV
jgi:hypothetical protein